MNWSLPMPRLLPLLLLPCVSLLATGCGNSCQQLCDELINYAWECGLYEDVPEDRRRAERRDDLSSCREKQSSNLDPEDLDACDWGLERIPVEVDGRDKMVARARLEWTCEELEINVLGGSNPDGDDDSAE